MVGKRSGRRKVLRPRFRIVCGKDIALGPGKVELLRLLTEVGSLNEAARRLKMSYMRAWLLVRTMNQCFRQPLITAERGGRSGGGMRVTETGHRALALYDTIESSALAAAGDSW